jgi:hypothetical protein
MVATSDPISHKPNKQRKPPLQVKSKSQQYKQKITSSGNGKSKKLKEWLDSNPMDKFMSKSDPP